MIFNTPEVRLLIRILAIIGFLILLLLMVSLIVNSIKTSQQEEISGITGELGKYVTFTEYC